MPATLDRNAAQADLELLTFRIGRLLMGVDIRHVKEINCHLALTRAPHAEDYVLGVMNLRSDVITVLDFGRLLRLTNGVEASTPHGVIVSHEGELIALAVDHVADVVTLPPGEMAPLPPNFRRQEERLFQGVYAPHDELILILDLAEALRKRAAK